MRSSVPPESAVLQAVKAADADAALLVYNLNLRACCFSQLSFSLLLVHDPRAIIPALNTTKVRLGRGRGSGKEGWVWVRVMTTEEDWLDEEGGRGTHATIVSFSTLIRLARSLVSCNEGISPFPRRREGVREV